MITLLLLVRATYMYGVVLHAHPVRGESHNQRNTTGEVAIVERLGSEFSTSVYRKPTFTGRYLRWNSFSPRKRKINLIGTLVYRAFMICSKDKLDPELDKIRSILLENGYPEHSINFTLKRKLQQLNSSQVHTVKKCPVYRHIPWI